MAKRIEDFKIEENHRLNNDIFILELSGNSYFPSLKPGQFAQVKVEGSPETFLRRPISIHDVDYERNTIKLLIQIAGKGTERLSNLKKGETINIIYPLGNSFSLPAENSQILLIGGGCGVAPLLHLAQVLSQDLNDVSILLGARSVVDLVELDQYALFGKLFTTTEDGSHGERGFVTDHTLFFDELDQFARIYCCGPEPMMKAVAAKAKAKTVNCEVSLENTMACGFGVCLCCVTETIQGHKCVCTDGPVFNTKQLKWQI